MVLEKFILTVAWSVSLACFYLFIPKDKRRNAHVSFLFMQVITWVLGLLVADLRWIEYPIDLFSNASKASFTFEYLVYPIISSFFNVYYPKNKKNLIKFIYYFFTCSLITGFELLLEKNTQLIIYINWTGYYTWITLFISLYISHQYYRWFFKLSK
jgi:hypothetical protein